MRRTLLMIAAVALLLTQCRKSVVEYPTAGPANENMVSMTVTVGHGGKTDISGTTGAITWSAGDKLYVGDGSKYIGCLTLVSGEGSATGTFSGSVSAAAGSYTFGFYYLGSGDYTSLAAGTTSVDISFASQTGVLADASSCHIGYGTAAGRVDGTSVILNSPTPVTMTSKVALAYFDFKKDDDSGYTDDIELSGDHIYNNMTVKFNGAESDMFTGNTVGGINLTSTSSSRKYVMLVPPADVAEETLNFGGGAEGTTKFYRGIEANKFYCVGAGEPIVVTVTSKSEFSVGENTTVEFAPGNLYWDGSAFRFEADQWSSASSWSESHVSHFYWSKSASVAYAASYSESGTTMSDEFFTNASGFQVSGETAGTWRTLSDAEWEYLLNTRTNATSLRAWKELDDGAHNGLVILPDGTENPSTVMESITSTADLATSGAVFLPAAGYRDGTDVYDASDASCGYCWSGTISGFFVDYACFVFFSSGPVEVRNSNRNNGHPVRLVRSLQDLSSPTTGEDRKHSGRVRSENRHPTR